MAKSYKFQIENYKVRVVQGLTDNWREISLTSVDLYHNIRVRAIISFSSKPNSWKQYNAIGAVTNMGGANYDGNDLLVVCDLTVFEGFYQVLSREEPVYLDFLYEDFPNQATNLTKRVLAVELKTDLEIPGASEASVGAKKSSFMPAKAEEIMQELDLVLDLQD